jgi:hypothetical protein
MIFSLVFIRRVLLLKKIRKHILINLFVYFEV